MLKFSKLRFPFREDRIFSIGAFVVLVLPLAFTIFTVENFETVKYSLWLILIGSAIVAFFSLGRKTKKNNLSFALKLDKRIGVFFVWLMLALVISFVFSVDRLSSLVGFYYRFTGSLLFFITLGLFFILLLKVLTKEKFLFLAKILVLDAFIIAIVGFVQSLGFAYYDGPEAAGFLRAPSLLGNPNFSSMFMVSILPLALVFLLESKKFYPRLYYLLAIFSILIASAVLASRGALLALGISLVLGLVLLLWLKFSKKIIIATAVTLMLFMAVSPIFVNTTRPETINNTVSLQGENISLRMQLWADTLKGMKEKPLFGTGPGTFHIFFEQVRDSDLAGQRGVFDDAHNLYLQLGANFGLVFLGLFLVLVLILLFFGIKELKANRDPYVFGTLVGIFSLLIAAAFTPVAIPCYVLLAVLLARLGMSESSFMYFSIHKVFAGIGKFAGVLLIIFGLSLITAEHIYFQGLRAYLNNDFKKSERLTGLALRLNPTNQVYYLYNFASIIKQDHTQFTDLTKINQFESLHENRAATYVRSANLYYLLFQESGQAKYLNFSIQSLKKALALDPYFAERIGQLAFYEFQLLDFENSKKHLQQALSLRSGHFPSWLLLAKIHQLEGNKEKALFALEKAYNLQPNLSRMQTLWKIAQTEPDVKKWPIQILVAQGRLE